MNLPLHTPVILRPYQHNLYNGVIEAMVRGDKDTLVISPTGSGKTVCFIKIAETLSEMCGDDGVVLILSHLSLLVSQTKAKFNKFSPLDVGILQGQTQPSPTDDVVISTMQSSRVFDKVFEYYETSGKKVKYIIVDESHMRYSDSYDEIFKTFPYAQVIDFTATPFKNKRLATGAYDSIAFQISLQELIEQKYLVPPVLKQIVLESDLPEKKIAIMLKTYLEYEKGKKAIMFMSNKEQCKLMSDALTQEGVRAAVVTDSVTGKKRDKIFEEYDNDDMDVLVSVNVLTAGFDSLKCESVFMFGTESPTAYLQRVGRALRPIDGDSVKPHHSKQDARIYVFGDTPTIESGLIEKHHNLALKPKQYKECETVDERVEWLEDNELQDTPEYKFNISAQKIQKIAKKINMEVLSRLIEEKSISSEFMFKLADTVDSFKPIQGGSVAASMTQRMKLQALGVDISKAYNSNEAMLLIQSLSGEKIHHNGNSPYILKEGKFAGSHVKDIPWAYKGFILKKSPMSTIARTIKAWHKSVK